jgi:hypothetical protein
MSVPTCGHFECVTRGTSYFELRLWPDYVTGVICVDCGFDLNTPFCISVNCMGLIFDVGCTANKTFSGYQPCKVVENYGRFGDHLFPSH